MCVCVCVCVCVRVCVCVFACVYASVTVKHSAVPVHVEDSAPHKCSSLMTRILGAFPKVSQEEWNRTATMLLETGEHNEVMPNVSPWNVENFLN